MRVLVARGRRVSILPVWERSQRLLVHEGSKDRAAAIQVKAKLELSVSQGQ